MFKRFESGSLKNVFPLLMLFCINSQMRIETRFPSKRGQGNVPSVLTDGGMVYLDLSLRRVELPYLRCTLSPSIQL